jgi:hypothetical protein
MLPSLALSAVEVDSTQAPRASARTAESKATLGLLYPKLNLSN